jgi:predicted dienelactone hydrolase
MDVVPTTRARAILRLPAIGASVIAFLWGAPMASAASCTGSGLTSADFEATGPFPVGVRTFVFVDATRPTAPNGDFPGAPDRTLVTEVWYPAVTAERDAPIDMTGAPYPVVVHSHGFLDSRGGEANFTRHLASRGYIVAAPDYPLSNGAAPGGPTVADVHNQPGDWSFVLDHVLAELAGAADPERIGASGLSLGGMTTLLVTYHTDLRDPRIDAALPMAPPGCFFTERFYSTTDTPLLLLHGDGDQIVPYRKNARKAYRGAQPPRFLVKLRDGSHTGFSDFAVIFDPSVHIDTLPCQLVLDALDDPDPDENPFAPLGGEEQGLDFSARCPTPCERPIPDRPSMGALRHHTLMKLIGSAFFNAYLRADDDARCFLTRTLDRENRSDVKVRSRGGNDPAAPVP